MYRAFDGCVCKLFGSQNQVNGCFVISALPCLRAPAEEAPKHKVVHKVNDRIGLALSCHRNIVPSPHLVVPVEVAGNHHIHRSPRPPPHLHDGPAKLTARVL
ncbi:hypothetical protein FOMG_20001 [Fusarium oxysporum f. sp. melonis 26406]|uniref:Uncharacterized protein n=1 Tax=Fusarium oxysporum f. sp. melonis 26406 TaxID=1089452 RepID=W9YUH0_FUSOX|nr:hypothetical protein FOMG_20001 [Fusarium oxysporum f. sp. melonis 26406]